MQGFRVKMSKEVPMVIIDAKQNRSAVVPALKIWVPDIDIESVSIYI